MNTQRPDPRIQMRAVRLSGWRAIVAVVAGLTALMALVVLLAVSFLFIVVPVMAMASIAYYFRAKPTIRSVQDTGNLGKTGPTGNATIIDGTFKVVPEDAEDSGNGQK